MALSYPLQQPTSIGIESITLSSVNAVATSQSPFTFKQQVISHQGQRWEASVTIPKVHRDLAAPWKSMLVGLKGQTGTFLLGDPDYATPRGSVTSCVLTGTLGSDEANVIMTGSLLEGDYIQLGSGSAAKLHMVLEDLSGSGTLQLWPNLRSTYNNQTVITDSAKGVFRLRENISSWQINNLSTYGISFEAVEAISG